MSRPGRLTRVFEADELAGRLLSVSIGLLNPPFPIDRCSTGDTILFYGIEGRSGCRPLSERVQEFGFSIGLALIVMLMIFTVWNDLSHFRSILRESREIDVELGTV